MIHKHEDLQFWQKSKALAVLVYKKTEDFPAFEKFGLTSQIRRAAVSVPSNIAEGAARLSDKEFIRFMNIAMGSLYELSTQIDIAREIGYMKRSDFEILRKELISITKMMSRFRSNLHSKL